MKINSTPTGQPSRRAKGLKFLGRSLVALGLLSLGNHYVPVIDGVTAATKIVSVPPLLTLTVDNNDLGSNGTLTIQEGQTVTVVAHGGDSYGYPVQVSLISGMPGGAQLNPSSAYGINPLIYFTWTPSAGDAASQPSTRLDFTSYNYFNRLRTTKSVTINVTAPPPPPPAPPSLAGINCLLDWAERRFPSLLPAPASQTMAWSVYTYRWYSATNAYVGVSSADNHVYYMGADGKLQDEGLFSTWSPQAGCQ